MPVPDSISTFLSKAGTSERNRERFKSGNAKLLDVLDNGHPYPLDMWIAMEGILNPSLETAPSFSSYPTFGKRLRDLKDYLDRQKPRTLKQIFKDRRDTVSYITFWVVIVVGGLSIILTLISIAVSSAQTVAAFEALNVPGRKGGSR
jgi:hypothetical protein